jgi:hypothetical protein
VTRPDRNGDKGWGGPRYGCLYFFHCSKKLLLENEKIERESLGDNTGQRIAACYIPLLTNDSGALYIPMKLDDVEIFFFFTMVLLYAHL